MNSSSKKGNSSLEKKFQSEPLITKMNDLDENPRMILTVRILVMQVPFQIATALICRHSTENPRMFRDESTLKTKIL